MPLHVLRQGPLFRDVHRLPKQLVKTHRAEVGSDLHAFCVLYRTSLLLHMYCVHSSACSALLGIEQTTSTLARAPCLRVVCFGRVRYSVFCFELRGSAW